MKTLKVSPAILRPVWQETLKVLETFRVCDVLGWVAPCGDAAGASAPCGDDIRAAGGAHPDGCRCRDGEGVALVDADAVRVGSGV